MNKNTIKYHYMNDPKQITLIYYGSGIENKKDLEILPKITVKNLKEEIKRLFNLNSNLQKIKLGMIKRGQRTGTLLSDENKTLYDYGIQSYSRIFFTIENIGGGGFPINFKFSNLKETEFTKFSVTTPKWRYIREGLNFYGICGSIMCDAGKDDLEVICPMKLDVNEEFNLIKNQNNIRCPICSSFIKLKTIGIYKCKIAIHGRCLRGKELEDYSEVISSNREDGIIKYKYGDFLDIMWAELIIKIYEYY